MKYLWAVLRAEFIMPNFMPHGLGWHPDLPDERDYTFHHPAIQSLLSGLPNRDHVELPDYVDLSRDDDGEYFTDVEDQGPLNSSCVFAALSLVEYFERRCCGRTFDASKMFLYKVACHRTSKGTMTVGNLSLDLRTTLKSLVQFGVIPCSFLPYDANRFNVEPSPFHYALAKPMKGIRYFRIDVANMNGAATWAILKSFLAAGFPFALGFSVPTSIELQSNILFRPDYDGVLGGQAVVAVGYRTNHFGPGQDAIRIRNSWGKQWGDNGYGWLPVQFILRQLASDFWTFIRDEWIADTLEFSKPSVIRAIELQTQ